MLPLVLSLWGCGNKWGAQQLGTGDRRVCQEGRSGAEKTNDVSIAPLQSCNAAWDFQPLFAWPAALESACCRRNGLCFMRNLAAAEEGGQSVSWLSGRIALVCLPWDNGKFLRGVLLDLGPGETGWSLFHWQTDRRVHCASSGACCQCFYRLQILFWRRKVTAREANLQSCQTSCLVSSCAACVPFLCIILEDCMHKACDSFIFCFPGWWEEFRATWVPCP